jgi:hypothetical protein
MIETKHRSKTHFVRVSLQGCQMLIFIQKIPLGYILENLEMENVGTFQAHLDFLWPIGMTIY